MSPAARFTRFAAVLTVVFALGWALGSAVEPVVQEPSPIAEHADHG